MPIKNLNDFTQEIQAKIPVYISKAFEGVFDGGRYYNFSLDKAQAAIFNIYEFCGHKRPLILVTENPYEAQLLFNYALLLLKREGNQLHNKLHGQLHRQLYSQLDSKLDNQLCSQLHDQFNSQLDNQLDRQLYNQLDSQLRTQLDSQLRTQPDNQFYRQLDSQLRSQLNSQLHNQFDSKLRSLVCGQKSELFNYNNPYLFAINVYSDCYFSWYKFLKDELNIPVCKNAAKLDEFYSLQKASGIYSACFAESFCVICKYPKKVYRNDNNDLHNTSGVAVEWEQFSEATKWDCYYINGRRIKTQIFLKALQYKVSREEFINESNEETKAAWYEILGQEKTMNLLGATLIEKGQIVHANGDIEIVELYKTKEKFKEIGNNPFAWVKFICPSSGTSYLIDVDPKYTSVQEAVISTSPFYGVEINSIKDYSFNARS